MPVTGFVQVGADGSGKKIHNVVQNVGGEDRYQQVVALGDPDDPSLQVAVRDSEPTALAKGLVVRQARPSFDSGLTTLPDTLGDVAVANLRVHQLFLVNLTDQVQQVQVQDGNGKSFLKNYDLPAAGILNLAWQKGFTFVNGVRWAAAVAATVNGQIVGEE